MLDQKNKFMIWIAASSVLLAIIIFAVTKLFDPFSHASGHGGGFEATSSVVWGQWLTLLLPIAFLAVALMLYAKDKAHPRLPLIHILILTFASMAIISGSGGSVEFHFSIFMVIAAAAYYENIRLILVMTVLFAVQHIAGFFFVPQLVFGSDSYSFLMLCIHALFLVLTSSATILQIRSKLRITEQLQAENDNKEARLLALIGEVQTLSSHIHNASGVVTDNSATNVKSSEQMRIAFEELTGALGNQASSVEQVEANMQSINASVQEAVHSSEQLKQDAEHTDDAIEATSRAIQEIQSHNHNLLETNSRTSETMRELKDSAERAQQIMAMIGQVADQTSLLALNASIEAARAGEHGRGFEIVAGEIRKLANESRRASEEIHALLQTIRQESEVNYEHVQHGLALIRETNAHVETFAADYAEIGKLIKQLLAFIGSVTAIMDQIHNGTETVTDEMNQIAAGIAEGLASMDNLTVMSEHQAASAETINREINQLSELSLKLQNQLTQR